MRMYMLASVLGALACATGPVWGHAALLWPPQMPFTPAFLSLLPHRMQQLTKHPESFGQDIPDYLLQSSCIQFWQLEGLPRPVGRAWREPCRVVHPTGKTYKVKPGGRLRVKTMTDTAHGGDFRFQFYRMTGRTFAAPLVALGSPTWVEGAGDRVDSGKQWSIAVPLEASVCTGRTRCVVQMRWETSRPVDMGIRQVYVGCALVRAC